MPKIPINFYYGSSEYLNKIPISEGNILYNITNKQILVDEDTKRQVYSNKTTVDTKLSTTSANPISNKVVSAEINALKNTTKSLQTDLTKKGTVTSNEVDDVRGQIHTNLLNPILQTTTINGVTCTNNGDGTFTLKGTHTGGDNDTFFRVTPWGGDNYNSEIQLETGRTYKIVGTPSGGGSTTYRTSVTRSSRDNVGRKAVAHEYGAGATFVAEEGYRYEVYIHPAAGITFPTEGATFKPMLTEDLSADYDSFVKYSGSEERINEQVASLHESSKGVITNLLNYDFETTTKNGVTCTNNGNGTYTLTGTASAYTNFMVLPYTKGEKVKKGKYKLVGCPKGGGAQKYNIWMCESSRGSDIDNLVEEYGDGVICNFEGAKSIHVEIQVISGVTLPSGGITFKPMLTTDLNATYNDYVPYSGDGRLNENVADIYKRTSKAETNITNINKTVTNLNKTVTTIDNTVTAINKRDEVSGKPTQCGTCGGSPLYRFHGNYLISSNWGANQTKDIPLSTFGVTLAKNQMAKIIRGSFILEDENGNQVFLPDRRKATTGMSVVGIYNNNLRIMTYGTAYNAGCNIEIDIEYVVW